MNEAASSGTDPAAVRRAVVEFIVADLAPHLAADSLSDDVNLVEDGVIDSLGMSRSSASSRSGTASRSISRS